MTARKENICAVLLLGAFFLLSMTSMRFFNATFDETAHLPAGYSYLKTHNIGLNPQHPPFIKILCALPLLAMDPRFDTGLFAEGKDLPNEWDFGRDFLYSNNADKLLFWGRMPVVLLGLALGVYVFLWARALYGPAAGAAALFLFAFSPNIIAHSTLVTMDLGLSLFSTASLYHLWQFFRSRKEFHLGFAGLAVGLALATKFSAIFLIPVLLILAISQPHGRTEKTRMLGFGTMLLAMIVVWALCFFPTDPLFYWKGLKQVNADHAQNYYSYLFGGFKQGGWRSYFLAAFLVKTPVLTLIMLFGAGIYGFRKKTLLGANDLFLLVPVAGIFLAHSFFATNIGFRYVLPACPLIFIFCSRLAPPLIPLKWGRSLLIAGGMYAAISAFLIFPDYLAYFNEAVGGPKRGHLFLDDSNIDWGQDLKRLKPVLDELKVTEVKLMYQPMVPPDYYGIVSRSVGDQDWRDTPSPGTYVMGTHVLIRGLLQHKLGHGNTDWIRRYKPVRRIGGSIWIFQFPEDRRGS